MKKKEISFLVALFLTASAASANQAYLPDDLSNVLKTSNCTKCDLTEASINNKVLQLAAINESYFTRARITNTKINSAKLIKNNFVYVEIDDSEIKNSDFSCYAHELAV